MARILVVDDDPDILKMAEKVLGSSGHTVLVAEDAFRAMEWLNQINFDLLLSDAHMPHYSGFELVRTVRNDDRYKDMAIAMLTGLRERKDVERAAKMGIDDYIIKPLDPILLLQKINALFTRKSPLEHPEVRLDGEQKNAKIQWPIEIVSVSELGLVAKCGFPVKTGMVLRLSADLFKSIGVTEELEIPAMKVLRIEGSSESGSYLVQMMFFGASETFLHKIRRWIFSHGANYTRAG